MAAVGAQVDRTVLEERIAAEAERDLDRAAFIMQPGVVRVRADGEHVAADLRPLVMIVPPIHVAHARMAVAGVHRGAELLDQRLVLGGYEVVNSWLAPGGGELLIDAAVELLEELKSSEK